MATIKKTSRRAAPADDMNTTTPAPPTPRAAATPLVQQPSAPPVVLQQAQLVEIWPPRVRRADLVIERGRIRGLNDAAPANAITLDCRHYVVMPGQLNAFARLHGSLLRYLPRGIAPTLQQRLRAGRWRYEAVMEPALFGKAVQLGALEALRAGVTTVVHRHGVELAGEGLAAANAAVQLIGLRALLGIELSNRLGDERAQVALRETEQFLLHCSKNPGRVRGLAAAESLGTLDGRTADRLADWSARYNVPVSLDFASASYDLSKDGLRASDWLRSHGLLHELTMLTGCSLLDEDEHMRIAQSGAACVALLAEGRRLALPDARRVLGNGRWLLGTAGETPSIFTAVREACERMWQDGVEASPLALFAHHQSLQTQLFAAPFGRLEPGAPADLIVAEHHSLPLREDNVERHAAHGFAGLHVVHAIVDGELVLRDGRALHVDEAELRAEVEAGVGELLGRTGAG